MSCSLCRLPFTPSPVSVCPRWPPPSILSKVQVTEMKYATAIAENIPGLVANMVYMDGNLFAVNNCPSICNVVWAVFGKSYIVLHPHCATLLRHHMGLSADCQENYVELTLLEYILGHPGVGVNAGRIPGIDYEGVRGEGVPPVDINSLWSSGGEPGNANFDWKGWERRGLKWTVARPDRFPRFHSRVSDTRLAIAQLPTARPGPKDRLTTLPLDVLRVILAHPALDNASFVCLLSTCRAMRGYAITALQPLARARVLHLGWAIATEVEYASFVRQSATSAKNKKSKKKRATDLAHLELAHAAHSPMDADWLLYLGHVHRTDSMRARRWVWALAAEVARVRAEKRAGSVWAEVVGADGKVVKSRAWKAQKERTHQMFEMGVVMRMQVEQGMPGLCW